MLEVSRRPDLRVATPLRGDRAQPLLRVLGSHPPEVLALHARTIAPLAIQDRQYHSELVNTVGAYLRHACDVDKTAAAVRAHRHVVVHRLERVKELTGMDCSSSADRASLSLGLKAHRVLAPDLPR
jgi:DNA-binding PucR family transcriptional regulator